MLDNTSGYRYTIDNKDERGTEPMIIDDLLRDAKMSQYKLSKESGVAQATISDICSRKTTMKKCAAGTLYRIAKTLNVTVDLLLEADEQAKENDKNQEYRSSFETFKSNTCHHVKDMGDIDFIIDTLEKNTIRNLYGIQNHYIYWEWLIISLKSMICQYVRITMIFENISLRQFYIPQVC